MAVKHYRAFLRSARSAYPDLAARVRSRLTTLGIWLTVRYASAS